MLQEEKDFLFPHSFYRVLHVKLSRQRIGQHSFAVHVTGLHENT